MGNVFPPTQVLNNWRVGAENPTRPANKQGVRVYRFYYFYYLSSTTLTYTHQCRQPNKNSPLPRFSGYSLGRAQWPEDCQGASVGKTGPSLPTVCSSFTDLSCSMTACHSLGLGDEDFAARTAVLNFGYGGCTPPFALDGFALSLSSLSARCGLSFCFTSCLHPAFYAFANLTLKNGRLKCPFSASNFDIRCHDLLHMSNPLGFTLFHRGFHHCSACDGSFLRLANLTLKNGRCKCPFSASNCVIRCHSLLESPSDKGFYHQCLCLTLMDGGCVLQLRLRSSNSLTCILPFLASNCVIPCQFTTGGLYCQFSASNCAIPCHFTDESLLLQFLASNCVILCQFTEGTCSYKFSASNFDSRCHSTAGSLYLQFLASNCVTRCQFTEGSCDFAFLTSNCVIRCHISIPSCVPCVVRCDSLACIVSPQLLLGSSVLPTFVLDVCVVLLLACFASRHCTSRVDSLASISLTLPATYAFPSLTCMTSHLCRTLTVTSASTLSFTCMFLLVAWLASDVCASLVGSSARTPLHIISTLAGDAPLLLGIFDRKVPTLPCHNAMELNEQSSTLLTLVCSLLVSMTLIVSILVRSDTSIGCMKNSWREFLYHNSLAQNGNMTNCHLSLRRLFVVNSSIYNSHVTQENEGSDEENFAWASSMQIIEEDSSSSSSLPSITFNGCHSSFDSTFASACTFFTSFTPSFHHTECPDEEGMLPPILDTGATHCLLPLRWMTHEQAERCKKIHLRVASGSSVRALLYNNIIYCSTVTRPLISVGQLKSMLDLRFVWDDSAPLVIACSGGLRYILAEASIFHNLPVISPLEMNAFLEAIHCFTENGRRWNALTWSQKLGRKLALFHWGTPTQVLPQDHSQFTEDPQVMFSSFTTDQILEASLDDPLLPTSMHVKSSSSSASPTTVVSDALPSSSVLTYDMRSQDPPTEDEETTMTRLGMASGETRTKKVQFCDPNSGRRKGRSTTKNDMRNDRIDDPSPLDDSPTHCHSSAGSTSTSQHDVDPTSIDARKEIDNSTSIFTNSISSIDSPQCHTTSSMIDPESIEDDIRVLMNHSLPKSPQRTNVITADYTPRGRLFGAYTRRGSGITHASLKYPDVLNAIHNIALTRPRDFTTDPYMSAQLNDAISLPVHKDKNNLSMTWLIAFGDFTGGRLWLESPIGTEPPPAPQTAWEKNLRGEYHSVLNTWVRFDPQLYHAVEPITSGSRRSLALFTPKNWQRLPPHCLDDLIDIGFCPPFTAPSTLQAETSFTSSTHMRDDVQIDDLANVIFGPLPAHAMTFTSPSSDEQTLIKEWSATDLVSLPFIDLPSSDGSTFTT